jgi:hypothetical protein
MSYDLGAPPVSRWCPNGENFRDASPWRLRPSRYSSGGRNLPGPFRRRRSSAAGGSSLASDIRRGKGTADEAGEPPAGFSRAWHRSRAVRSRRCSSRPARARGAACFHHNPPFAAVQGRALDPTLLPRLRNRRQVTRHSKIDHGVRSPWSIGSRSRWPRSRSGSK